MNKEKVEKLNISLKEVISAWARENGLEFLDSKASITYSGFGFEINKVLKFAEKGESDTVRKAEFLANAQTLNYKLGEVLIREEDFENSFEKDGVIYTLVEINNRARKFPLEFTTSDGRRVKISEDAYLYYK